MRPYLHRPSPAFCRKALKDLEGLPLTYWERGATDWKRLPQGYAHAVDRVSLGCGDEVWASAKTALTHWACYPQEDWIGLSDYPPISTGQQVMVVFRVAGLWWTSPCRIIYVIDEPERFGFAYGTLPGHVESGEELFLVEREPATGEVHYEIRMMANAAHPLARLVPTIVSAMQRRFRKTSMRQMSEAVGARPDPTPYPTTPPEPPGALAGRRSPGPPDTILTRSSAGSES